VYPSQIRAYVGPGDTSTIGHYTVVDMEIMCPPGQQTTWGVPSDASVILDRAVLSSAPTLVTDVGTHKHTFWNIGATPADSGETEATVRQKFRMAETNCLEVDAPQTSMFALRDPVSMMYSPVVYNVDPDQLSDYQPHLAVIEQFVLHDE
jgi:hypothetical protein